MLGLGLAVTVGKRILGGVIESLMSALRGRAEYSENNTDSKAVVKDIDNYDLLDKATILLTPTATSDARVHSVKTYTGDELVVNGDFSDGTTGWTTGNSGVLSIVDGALVVTGNGGSFASAKQIITGVEGKTYKVTGKVAVVSGSYNLVVEANQPSWLNLFTTFSTDFVNFEAYFVCVDATIDLRFTIYNAVTTSSDKIKIDNISIVDVSSDFDFDRASSATRINSSGLVQDMQSITDPELVLNGDFEELGDETTPASDFSTSAFETNPTSGSVSESNGTLTFNNSTSSGTQVQLKNRSISDSNTYKITFTLSNFTSGTFRMSVGNQLTDTINYNDSGAEGTHTFYVTKTGGSARNYFYTGGTSVVVSNISVKQVDPNNRWSLGTGWSIEDGKASFDGGADNAIQQSSVVTNGNTYKVIFDVADRITGNLQLRLGNTGVVDATISANGTYTNTFVSDGTSLYFRAIGGFDGSIDNISVKDITFSTDVDLARINYDSNGDNGHILLEPTSTNLVPYSQTITELRQQTVTVLDNQTISPDGTQNASSVTKLGTSANDRIEETISVSNSTSYNLSVFVKNSTIAVGGKTTLAFRVSGGTLFRKGFRWGASGLSFTSIYGSGTITNEILEDFGNGWYRIGFSFTTDGTSGDIELDLDRSNGSDTTTLFMWGFQLEQLPYATSYIPSLTGSTVTRATETLTGSGNSTLINSTEGVLYAEIAALANDLTNRQMTLSDGSDNNRIVLKYDNQSNVIQAFNRVGGVETAFLSASVTDIKLFSKCALKYKVNDYALWIDGIEVATDTSSTTFSSSTLNDFKFGDSGGSSNFYGKCKALAVFNEALSDTELENLTS